MDASTAKLALPRICVGRQVTVVNTGYQLETEDINLTFKLRNIHDSLRMDGTLLGSGNVMVLPTSTPMRPSRHDPPTKEVTFPLRQ